MLKKVLSLGIALTMCVALCAGASAASNEVGIISGDAETGVTIYRDAAGGIVVSGIGPGTEDGSVQNEIIHEPEASMVVPYSDEPYVDYEENPIYIGTWNGVDCYARHTLGSYDETIQYLTSYGYASWYNTSGNTAVPYRNGAANNNSGQGVVDVAKFSYFDIRDLETDNKTTLQITDWGPDQLLHPDRIADLDKSVFKDLHGNTSDGLFYARTWVPITNYNP